MSTVVRDAGGWLFVDASQSVGQMPVDFAALEADVLFFPARKWLRGPCGVAGLVISDRALDAFGSPAAPDIHGSHWSFRQGQGALLHSAGAARFQPYAQHPALRLGLAAAINTLLGLGVLVVQARIRDRACQLRRALNRLPNIQILDGSSTGLVAVTPRRELGSSSDSVVKSLWAHGINAAAVGARYAPLLMSTDESIIRFSPHAITTDEEIERVVSVLQSFGDL